MGDRGGQWRPEVGHRVRVGWENLPPGCPSPRFPPYPQLHHWPATALADRPTPSLIHPWQPVATLGHLSLITYTIGGSNRGESILARFLVHFSLFFVHCSLFFVYIILLLIRAYNCVITSGIRLLFLSALFRGSGLSPSLVCCPDCLSFRLKKMNRKN